MKFLAKVNPVYFAAISLFAAKNDVRYYLNGVHIERNPGGGVLMVGTNGHYLSVIHDPEGWIEEGRESLIVGDISKALFSACANKRKNNLPLKGLHIAEHFSIVSQCEDPEPFGGATVATIQTSIVDDVFPNWRRVAPEQKGPVKRFPLLNGKYIALYAKASEILTDNKFGCALDLRTTEEEGKVVVRIPGHYVSDLFFGLIMPLRHEAFHVDTAMLPSYMPQPKRARLQYRGAEQVTTTGA
jgi:DNA polymerase-3 subunit beta